MVSLSITLFVERNYAMLTDELIYIGNQLAEMTDRELSEVLNQFKRRRNYCLAGEVSSYLNKIMRANDFDYYGEIVEIIPEKITARRNEINNGEAPFTRELHSSLFLTQKLKQKTK